MFLMLDANEIVLVRHGSLFSTTGPILLSIKLSSRLTMKKVEQKLTV